MTLNIDVSIQDGYRIIDKIGDIYQIESTIRGMSPDVRLKTRKKKSEKLVNELFAGFKKAYTQFISDYRLYSFKIIINSTMHVICDSWPRLIKKAVNFLLKFFARFKKLIISGIFVHNFP